MLDLLDLPVARPMNRDLEEWAEAQGAASSSGAAALGARGPCRDCGKPAEATCLKCEAPTCSRHYRVMVGLCLRCSPEAEEEVGSEGRPDLDIPWIG